LPGFAKKELGMRRTMLGMAMLLAAISGVVLGCGGGGNNNNNQGDQGTTPGSYVVTVAGVSGAYAETGTVALTVQ